MSRLHETIPNLADSIKDDVAKALAEDVGSGDITAELIPKDKIYKVTVISRENAILCGKDWVVEVFQQVDDSIELDWFGGDGDQINPNQTIFTARGAARSILTAERTALNFLQLLSGVATKAHRYAQQITKYDTQILDTRKTIPGLRIAQKYAVRCGGCHNHRIGLYDAFLIKENHIAASGSIEQAIQNAKALYPDKVVEIEVENLQEFRQALTVGADIIMLDDMSLEDMRKAVIEANGKCKIEASGNMNIERIEEVAKTGVDFISIGALTKHIQAIDLSMRFVD